MLIKCSSSFFFFYVINWNIFILKIFDNILEIYQKYSSNFSIQKKQTFLFVEKYSIILTSLKKKKIPENSVILSSLSTDYNSAHCLATRHSSARDTSCGQFTGKKTSAEMKKTKKKKRRGKKNWG